LKFYINETSFENENIKKLVNALYLDKNLLETYVERENLEKEKLKVYSKALNKLNKKEDKLEK
jgi:hypothetical protein